MNFSAERLLKTGLNDLKNNKKLLIRILVIILILLSSVALRVHEASKADISVEAASQEQSQADEIYVDIGGAVVDPGVYKVTNETRLYEVIEMAGGLRSDANIEVINQAEFVEDGEKIIIPVVRQDTEDEEYQSSDEGSSDASPEYSYSSSSSGSSGLVNINTASADELKTLTGIGDVIAERIIEYRKVSGFRSIEDIKSVKGIGDAIFEKIKEDITV